MQKVHFHEVGGIDALVDIIGTALCIEYLHIKKITASQLPLGSGFTKCRHGVLPVPVPAVTAILKNIPVYGTQIPYELVTPTGAAIISVLASSFGPMPVMTITKSGYGAGTRDLEAQPNMLRVILGEAQPPQIYDDKIIVVETNIDDMNPEIFGFLMERLFAIGALDVCMLPLYMKKNRPATMVQVLCQPCELEAVIACILRETTTSGVRYYETRRRVLIREKVTLSTSFGPVGVKRIQQSDGSMVCTPEYDQCRQIALAKNIAIKSVFQQIISEIAENKS